MRLTLLDNQVTNTHSECVTLVAFPLQTWLNKCASMLRYTYIACLVFSTLTFEGLKVRQLLFDYQINNTGMTTVNAHRPGCSWFGWERLWIIRADGGGERGECEAWTDAETFYRSADKSLARPGRKQATAAGGFHFFTVSPCILIH